ncbi:formyltransferase family protein [Vibrio owensii]|uniref:formyltransferase family protein n=1 Tax=Vibrio owensii TaxID=696485 RepID=UPI0005EFD5ED|nr:formyltransferase family protein [Vibrio owensii]
MKIIVFGNVPLSGWLIEELFSSKLELLGVVYDDHEIDDFSHHGLAHLPAKFTCEKLGIKRISFSEAQEMALQEPILGISVRYHKLFKKDYFESFTPGIINLHGGELPRFRGTNIANHVVLQGVNKAAGTLHFIDEGVDCGDVVLREFFDVNESSTAFEVFSETMIALQKATSQLIRILENGEDIPRVPQSYFIDILDESPVEYKKRDLNDLKEITLEDVENGTVGRKVRAFTFGNHSGAFFREGECIYSVSRSCQ